MTKILSVTEARKNLYSIIDECVNNGETFVLTLNKKRQAVRILNEQEYEELLLIKKIKENPELLSRLQTAIEELNARKT